MKLSQMECLGTINGFMQNDLNDNLQTYAPISILKILFTQTTITKALLTDEIHHLCTEGIISYGENSTSMSV